jgi:hypothetical protein
MKTKKTKKKAVSKSRKPVKYFQARCTITREPVGMPSDSALQALENAFSTGFKPFRQNSRGQWVEALVVDVIR